MTNWYTPSSSGASGPGRACGERRPLHRLAGGAVLPVGQIPEFERVRRIEIGFRRSVFREGPHAPDVGAVEASGVSRCVST